MMMWAISLDYFLVRVNVFVATHAPTVHAHILLWSMGQCISNSENMIRPLSPSNRFGLSRSGIANTCHLTVSLFHGTRQFKERVLKI